MMATSKEDQARGHELYLRHLLLLEQAVPVALKAVIKREVRKRGKSLTYLIDENKDTLTHDHKLDSLPLFESGKVDKNIDSWDIRLLCFVIKVLFQSELDKSAFESIACISDQRNDLDNYAHDVFIAYRTFKEKWDQLHAAILEVIKDITNEAQFECKRMIYSFESEPINVNMELVERMKQTPGVKMHVQMAIQEKVSPKIHGEMEGPSDGHHQIPRKYDDPVFIESLQDTLVYIGEPVVLTCELNISDVSVKWQKDKKMAEETDTLQLSTYGNKHWLVIARAQLTDSGLYSCVCGTTSTKAFLKVSDKPSKITEDLHVTPEHVVENMQIVLKCQVNVHTDKAVWRHNGKEIKQCYRYHFSVQGLEHKLIIQNVQFEDEGEYTVVFGDLPVRVQLIVQGNTKRLYDKQLIQDLYRDWIRAALGLKFLKLGLESFSDEAVRNHHSELLKELSGNTCTNICTMEKLLPSHKQNNCPRKRQNCLCSKPNRERKHCPFCSTLYDKICCYHETFNPVFENTDVKDWNIDPWSVATCYISTKGYKEKTSAKEVDCSGLLSLFINNTFIRTSLDCFALEIFEKARDARNDIFHNANYELTKDQFEEYIDLFKRVLEIKDSKGNQAFTGKTGVKDVIQCLDQLRKKQIDIRTAEEFEKHIKDLKEHAMTDLAQKLDIAKQENGIKLQLVEKRLKDTEKELQLMRDLRLSQKANKEKTDPEVPFELELHIQVIGKTEEATKNGNWYTYSTMIEYRNGTTASDITGQSVQRIFGYITSIKNCEMVDVLMGDSSVCIKVQCFTCKATGQFLKVTNGNEFQKETSVLKARLQALDVIVSCSSESMEITRKRLNMGQTRGFACHRHENTECTWYCSDHDEFCCSACKDTHHRACVGIKQMISGRSYEQQKQSLVFKSKIQKYNVRIKNRLINRGDKDQRHCNITSIRVIPDGHILVLDIYNKRLKKLNSSYNLVSHCDLPGYPVDMCYIGKDTAIVSLMKAIQYVNVSDNMKLLKQVELQHFCDELACHGDTLYIKDRLTLYKYNKECEDQRVLYRFNALEKILDNRAIGVSDDGERIYIVVVQYGLITIDNEGNHLFTLKNDVLEFPQDVCVVCDGTVLVLNGFGHVLQVDYKGEHILGTVVSRSDGLVLSPSLSYDRKRCRIIVGDKTNYISVYDLMSPSDTTDVK